MTRTSLENHNCAIARAAEVVADRWSILLIREAMYGINSFTDFQRHLGVSRNVLADRLEHLVQHQVFEKVQTRPGVERYVYQLTERGRALFPMIVGLAQWGNKWIFGPDKAPIRARDKVHSAPVQQMGVMSRDGRFLGPDDIEYIPGPGADEKTKAFLEDFKKKLAE